MKDNLLILVFIVCVLAIGLFFVIGEKSFAITALISLIGFYAIFGGKLVSDEREMRNCLDGFRASWAVMILSCTAFQYFYQTVGRSGYELVIFASVGTWALVYFIFNKIR